MFFSKARTDKSDKTPAEAMAAVANLEARLIAAETARDEAKASHAATAFAVDQEGSSASALAALARSRKSVERAEATVQDLRAVLEGARSRHRQALIEAEEKSDVQAWEKVSELLAKREALTQAAMDQGRALAKTLPELMAVNAEAYKTIPRLGKDNASTRLKAKVGDITSTPFSPSRVEQGFRNWLWRTGIHWASRNVTMSRADTVADFDAVMAEASQWIESIRPGAAPSERAG